MVPVSWRVHREVVLLLGWGRAILLQLAHPMVAQGVADHSRFRVEGLGRLRRLHRTLGAMLALTFGTPAEAEAIVRRVNGIHDRVQGRLPVGAGSFASGTPYSAHDPALLRWVHVTCVDSFLLAYRTFVAPLTPAERDAYCAETAEIETALGMPAGALPRTERALEERMAAMLAGGDLHVGDTARALAEGVVRPPLAWLGGPAVPLLRLATVGLLPPAIREAYGFPWSPRRERALAVSAALIRGLLPLAPSIVRHWPVARRAFRRGAVIIQPHAAHSTPARRSVMKAIRVHAPGGPEVLRLDDVPQPSPTAGEALVKVDAAGLNYIDVYYRTGMYKAELPLTIGLEAGGTVTAVGPSVSEVKVGDKVAYTGVPGAYAEYAVVPAQRLVVLPAGVSPKQGAAAMLQGMTAHYLACSTYPLKHGDTCLVHAAAGGVGLLLCQIAKLRGARVIGTVSTDEKAKLAREAGADETIIYTRQDFEAEVKRLTGGKGVQVVYDAVGKTTWDKSLGSLALRGLIALYGQSSGPIGQIDPQILNAKGSLFLTRPSLAHHTATREELLQRAGEVLGWVREGKLKLRMEFEFPLKDAGEAHRALEGRKTTGKVLLIP